MEDRQRQKAEDNAFRKEIRAEKDEIAKGDYPFRTFYLGPPPTPRIKAPKKEDEEDDFGPAEDENETYVKADVHLREALRVVGVPYSDTEISEAAGAVQGKTELDALVSYLQVLGTAVK